MSIRFIRSFVVILSLFATRVTAQTLPPPDNLTDLRSQQGEQFLLEAQAHEAYFAISTTFETQKNQAYCGVASIVMALNAIQAPAPASPEYEPYHTFTQDNLLDDRTETVLPRAILARQGMTLDQLGQAMGQQIGGAYFAIGGLRCKGRPVPNPGCRALQVSACMGYHVRLVQCDEHDRCEQR